MYFYLMVLFFIVIGMVWKWILNLTMGLQKVVYDLGFIDFIFDWFVNWEMSVYIIVIVGVW